MRYAGLFGLGALFIGMGFGWLVFNAIGVTGVTFAWLLMGIGVIVVASSLISWRLDLSTAGIATAFSIGLVISLLFVAGLPIFTSIGPVVGERTQRFSGEAVEGELSFEVVNVNGFVRVSTWDQNRYNATLLIRARGWSDVENAETLAQVSSNLNRQVEGGKLKMVLVISVPNITWRKLEVNVNVTLPVRATTDLSLETVNGDLLVSGLKGGHLELETTNGAVRFDNVNASAIGCSTTNGVIYGVVEAGDLRASSVNGGMDFRIPSRRSGTYRLNLVNGNIDISVKPSSGKGFSADLSTVNGQVSIDLPDVNYTTNTAKRKIGQTAGFDSSSVRIDVKVETVNGNIRLAADALA